MFYAKSNPVESIKEHTDKLLENMQLLKKLYGEQITKEIDIEPERFWKLLEITCKYHDAGKVFSAFQNVIRQKLGEKLILSNFDYDLIKHEQISPMFVPYKEYEMTKNERKLVYQAIYYHHERDQINIDRKLLEEIKEKDIIPNLDNINKELGIYIKSDELSTFYLGMVEGQNKICEGDELYKEYCLLKGLLNRLDHCSSASICIEDDTDEKIVDFVEMFIKHNNFSLNEIQKFSKENQNNNLIVIGSTGIGKTESALIWSKNDKTFFTLPLRISINAIYDRIREQIKYEHVGLLHSTALDYLEEKSEFDNELLKINQSRNLYEKITTCTIDQIFSFVFKYKGYEKIYSTLSYSKVIIDEIQAYSPEIVAIILKGLQMINDIGGKFMIMTATLPKIYKEELQKMGIKFEYKEFIKNTKRHKIKIADKEIIEDIDGIMEKSKSNKTLVIVNTINKATEIYLKLKELGVENINLLHSRYILNDRREKEKMILDFSKNKEENGIWITTQIVEASLDIDFDFLYTEMSTLDSLFQRLGRCYRSREYNKEECNVIVYTKNPSGIKYVYDEDINKKSVELLKQYDNQILDEDTKVNLVDILYSKEVIGDTEFYKKFKNGMNVLDNIVDYGTKKSEAQKLIRKIDNINVIPRSVYDDNIQIFENYADEKDKNIKAKLSRNINKLILSISSANKYRYNDYLQVCPYKDDILIIDMKYDNEIGLLLKQDEEYEIDTRML